MLVINDEFTVNYLRQQELQEQDFYVGILFYITIFTLLIFRSFMTYIKKYTDLK